MSKLPFALLGFLMIFSACKKDEEPLRCGGGLSFEFSQANFLLDIHMNSSYTYGNSSQNDYYDQVIGFEYSDDSLRFLDWVLPVDSAGQVYFDWTRSNFGGQEDIHLTFFPDVDSVYAFTNFYDNQSGPTWSYTYSGRQTQLEASVLPHTDLDQLQGDYDLDITTWHFSQGVDDQVNETRFVTRTDYDVKIGDESIYAPLFHSYYRSNSTNGYPAFTQSELDLTWKSDSIRLLREIYWMEDYEGYQDPDTLIVLYEGQKL